MEKNPPETQPPVAPPPMKWGWLWLFLLAPPFAIGAVTPLALKSSPETLSLFGFVPLFVFLGSLAGFIRFILPRYRNPSLTLLIFGYILGEIIICFAAFFGACLISLQDHL